MIRPPQSPPRAPAGAFAQRQGASFLRYSERTMLIHSIGRLGAAFGLSTIAFTLSSCSLLAPFDSKFQCERSRDFGKCTDVQGAYTDALGGQVDPEHPIEEPNTAKDKKHKTESVDIARTREDDAVGRSNLNRYKAAEYAEMAGLIEKPITPVIAPPKVLRTLVVAYATPEKTLFLPRYVYYFVSEGNFVMGDYLNAERPEEGATVYPNGQPGSFR